MSEEDENVEILTQHEKEQIDKLHANDKASEEINKSLNFFGFSIPNPLPTYAALGSLSPTEDHSYAKYLGLKKNIIVNNISGKKAWIILAPGPITGLSSISLDKVGQLSFTSTGDYKYQQSPLLHNTLRKFDLDNVYIYYTVFFECDGKWKMHFKDRKINAKKHDINLLERHVEEAVDFDISPLH